MSRLITAEVFYDPNGIMGLQNNGTNFGAALWANYLFPSSEPVSCQGDTDAPEVTAFVNQGRWMVSCPFGCGSAQVASETDHRFYCCGPLGCQNYNAGNMTIPVIWPDPVTQGAIEDLLMERPQVFRNWFPWESLEQLQAENAVKGGVV